MDTPKTPDMHQNQAGTAAQLAVDLAQLRDALVTLSLSLRDWQFVRDQCSTQIAQRIAEQSLRKFRRADLPNPDQSENTPAATSAKS